MIVAALPTKQKTWLGFGLIAALFLASGFSSLIYQVVWTRMLVLIFGSTTFATSTVLAVFMGGLALGSFVAGRYSDKIKRPFLWYGIAEAVIGVWALVVPFMFSASVPLYRVVWQQFHPTALTFGLTRFFMATIILIVPTSFMGATLPLLSRFVTSSLAVVGKRVGTLYAVNTLGAVAGSALAGFAMLPTFGLSATTLISALVNFLLCGAVIWSAPSLERGRQIESEVSTGTEAESEPAAAMDKIAWLAIFSFGISGAVAMIYEVGWTRTLLMVIGSSTYAFTIMLSTFLVGIFAGSLICARWIDKAKYPLIWFAGLEITVCFFGLTSMALFNYLPWWNLQLNSFFPHDPSASLAARFILSALILLPLTLCLGAIFPAIVKATTRHLTSVGRSVGTLYSVNTLGAIIGAFAAGFLLVPWLGVERTLIAASAVNLAVGLVLLLSMSNIRLYFKVASLLVSLPFLFWCAQMPELWDKMIMLTAQSERRHMVQSSLGYKNFEEWTKSIHDACECLFWKDGASSTVGIGMWRDSKHRSLITNGHVDASDGVDKQTQILLAAYPLLWNADAKDVAVVGWGSGMSLGTVSLFPVDSITAVELEPSVIDASKFFHHLNHRPELNPKVHIELNDGRNYLLATNKQFDAIISEPSNPWQAGVCNLFTREYFEVCRERLKPGGIFSFWLQIVEIPPENLKEILAALNVVFPNNLALFTDRSNMVVLASEKPLVLDYARFKKAFENKSLVADLSLVDITSPEAVLARVAAAPDGIASLVAGAHANIDDNNRLEYAVGKTYENVFFMNDNKKLIGSFFGTPWKYIQYGNMAEQDRAGLLAEIGRQALLSGRYSNALAWAGSSLALMPGTEAFRVAGIALAEEGKRSEARKMWEQALKIDEYNVLTLQTRGLNSMEAGEMESARADFEAVLASNPQNKVAQFHVAETYATLLPQVIPYQETPVFFPATGNSHSPQLVIKYVEPLTNDAKFVKNHPDIFFFLGQAQYELGQLSEAEGSLRKYIALEPESISGQRVLGCVLQAEGKFDEAAGWLFKSFTLARNAASNLWRKASDELKSGNQKEAIHLMAQCLQLWPSDDQVYSMLLAASKNNAEAARAVKAVHMLGMSPAGSNVSN